MGGRRRAPRRPGAAVPAWRTLERRKFRAARPPPAGNGLFRPRDRLPGLRQELAIDLAASVPDERGTIVEATFTSIPDVAASTKWGWLPVGPLITQRFDSMAKVRKLGSPLLVVHGDSDSLIDTSLGRKLYEAAAQPKKLLVVEGGTHHSTMSVGFAQYKQALSDVFGLH
jgi:pimeloyl-ACP methyl ester carboxylesterase